MTLREIVTHLEDIARQMPDVRLCLENDITRLNAMREAEYGVFGITQGEHTGRQGWMEYTLNLFFIDRLVNGQDNELEIQSHAIELLRAVLMKAGDTLEIGEVRYTAFTQRFQDLCAGAWAAVTILTPEGNCNDFFND